MERNASGARRDDAWIVGWGIVPVLGARAGRQCWAPVLGLSQGLSAGRRRTVALTAALTAALTVGLMPAPTPARCANH